VLYIPDPGLRLPDVQQVTEKPKEKAHGYSRGLSLVFHVLRWTPRELDRTIAALLEEGVVREMHIEGMEDLQLVSTSVLGCIL
jgi:hypothetical protein